MADTSDLEGITTCTTLCDAIWNLTGAALHQALGQIAGKLLDSPNGQYSNSRTLGDVPQSAGITIDIVEQDIYFGSYSVSGRNQGYGAIERQHLVSLAQLSGKLLHAQQKLTFFSHAAEQRAVQLRQQEQILDQIHESVMTMDRIGFITSWNKGAERLFGYTASEVLGRNILFLYEDEDEHIYDAFLEQGGREMEVRRRKKSGEVFWASLNLSPLRDPEGNAIGLIGFLSDITERKRADEQIHHLAYYDALTGLPNRTLLMKLIDQALSIGQRRQMHGSVLFIDLNRFKPINDTLGHAVGDQLLQQIAIRFRTVLRDADVVARLGSDEFAVALFDVDQHYHASLVAQKLLSGLEVPFVINNHELRIRASIGISVYPQDGHSGETLLRLADIAMYRAKKGIENIEGGYAFYSEDMNQRALDRLHTESGLRRAIKLNELLLNYQPKVDLRSGRIIGAEALVRWLHPELGLMAPVNFIPIAEETGLIVQVGEWVMEAACAQAQAWQQVGIAPFRIAVNVSAREFTAALPARVILMLRRYALAPEWLELEITESTLMQDIDRVTAIMDQISQLGVTLSLDDFGTGYSSLSYLKRFPIDTLKIDRSFTTGIPHDINDCAIASTIISIAKQLKHTVIAEGVENLEQLLFLQRAGCDEMQGYLFSRPVHPDEFENMLRSGQHL